MRRRLAGTTEALRSPFPWIALTASLALSAAGWFALERSRHDEARAQFERRTETAVASVRARMQSYEQILRSAAAFRASSTDVTPEDWLSFIANLQLEERFPGIEYVAYSAHGPAIADTNPKIRAAIEVARDRGEPAITGRVTFAGSHAGNPSFVMVVPVFHDGARRLPAAERRNAVSGYVSGAMGMRQLMRGLLDEGVLRVVDMRIQDAAETGEDAVLLDTRGDRPVPGAMAPAPLFERAVNLPMPARAWTVRLTSRPDFDARLREGRPWEAAAAAVLASFVVFLLVVALVGAWDRAHSLSMRDPLTGLFNRRYLEETMGRELPRARRLGQGIGCIVIDLDHFKQLNDAHGHDAGDCVLARFGELLRQATRGSDIACRFGGEEFGVILPGATPEATRKRAEAIRAAYESVRIDFEGVPLRPLSLSAGVSFLTPGAVDWSQALRDADRALYAAKQAGRNRVVAL
jgi:diguanylate cyclase (GGDEF)-like protein